jgi:23S rRNA pseudouridine2605 synthase
MMAEGRVRVNGVVVSELGSRLDPEHDLVEVDGKKVEASPTRWVLLHKPAGTLTTRKDSEGRRTVYEVLPDELGGLHYVGRLDRDTTGLLLLTNDGEVAHRLLHPSSEVEREYEAVVAGRVGAEAEARLLEGVELDDGPARAVRLTILDVGKEGTRLTVVLREGRKREVRRLFDALGHSVRYLTRVRFGPITLGGLKQGEWRELTDDEVRALRRAAGLGET